MLAWNPQWGDIGELGTHRGFVYNPEPTNQIANMGLGSVASFRYGLDGKPRLVFIMHANFQGKCHALTLKNIDRKTLLEKVYPHIEAGMSNPDEFYYDVYRPVLLDTDAYRTYLVSKISTITMFEYSVPKKGSDADMMEKLINDGRKSDAQFMRDYDKNIDKESNK